MDESYLSILAALMLLISAHKLTISASKSSMKSIFENIWANGWGRLKMAASDFAFLSIEPS